ncbi:LysR substrate-binding domain-containing protein [Acuticoccus sp. I52.16.1]|uniref:LysR substrate-binding domain-containing protein n=1 Tax=Acuticoccus sp. I52.16.1 TaxID=2928472 RepID=UPI001FD34A0A|nr:LysR substrate-binding domain-containing protein [Acuticoccus sp. I52.16.1]UOM34937.1 LysR substrate-binding domain-containing protein [Acuticoccus sp. I52.16.1]
MPAAGLNTDLMRTFVAVADLGGFRAAASRVHRTPSAISMQMAKLEEDIGTPLFVKTGRTTALSAAGEELLTYARRILDLSEEAMERLRGREIGGYVCFGVPDDRGARLLPGVLSRFARSYPNVEVEVLLAPSKQLLERLEKRTVDLIVVSNTPGAVEAGGEVVYSEELVWVGLEGGRARDKRPVPLAVADAGCQWRHIAVEALESAGIAYRIAVTSGHAWGQLAAVEADLAIAPLPVALVDPGLERVDGALPPLGRFQDRMCMVPNASRATQALAEALRESLHAYREA